MLLAIIQFVLSAIAVAIAGTFLVRFSDRIAEITQLGRLLVGSLFLASATSLPELFVDMSAVQERMPNLALGDLIGSSLFNLFILAIADLLHKSQSKIFSRASAAHALAAAMSISLSALTGIFIFVGDQFNFSVGEIGLGPLIIVIVYVLGMRMIYHDEHINLLQTSTMSPTPSTKSSLLKPLLGYFSSAFVILIVAPLLAHAAGDIASLSGLGKTFIGTTLVAFSTSLPELVSTIAAVRMGAYDLALGNIFGSNTFNMVLIAPLDFIYPGALLSSVSKIHVFTCLSTIVITSVAVMGQLYQVEKRKSFIEPDALTVMALCLGTFICLYYLK